MPNPEISTIRTLEPVQRFAQAAEAFCILIESHNALSAYRLLRQAADLLPALYTVGLALPDVEVPPVEKDKPDAFYDVVPIKHTAALGRDLGAKFDSYNLYWQTTDPFEDEHPVAPTLGDDLADMYGDLKRGLIAYNTGSDQDAAEAVWHWKFSFGNHWGRHLVGALRAIHYILFDYLITDQ